MSIRWITTQTHTPLPSSIDVRQMAHKSNVKRTPNVFCCFFFFCVSHRTSFCSHSHQIFTSHIAYVRSNNSIYTFFIGFQCRVFTLSSMISFSSVPTYFVVSYKVPKWRTVCIKMMNENTSGARHSLLLLWSWKKFNCLNLLLMMNTNRFLLVSRKPNDCYANSKQYNVIKHYYHVKQMCIGCSSK